MTKILVVDDSRLHRVMVTAVLTEGGYETVEAEDGLEALAKIASENPDLIVLDRVMPKMDGTEVCQRLKDDAFTQHLPVLMLTSLDATSDKVEGLKLGADGYLTKPFHPEELLARIGALLRRAHGRAAPEIVSRDCSAARGCFIWWATVLLETSEYSIPLTGQRCLLDRSLWQSGTEQQCAILVFPKRLT